MGKNETKMQPVPLTTRKRKRPGFDARAGTPPSGFWHVGEASSAQGNGSKGLAMSKRLRLGAWVVALVAALAVVVGGIGVAFAAVGDTPPHAKTIKDNKDGTYTVALNVKGDAEKKPSKANVIVIFDTSSSMNTSTGNTEVTYTPTSSTNGTLYGYIDGEYHELTRTNTGSYWNPSYHFWYDGQEYTGQRYRRQQSNQSRLQAAEEAVNELAAALLEYNGKDGNPDDTIEMALVDFANMAEIAQEPTTDYDTFAAVVNSRDAGNNDRGTNWEAGLRTANDVDFDDKDPTYVIFVSDGNPTFYLQDPNNTQRGGSGLENDDNVATSYNQAVPAARALASAVGAERFYTIGVYGNVTRMESLTTSAGAPSGNYYAASDTAALQDALGEILSAIEMAGIGNVSVDDGTTNQVKTNSGDVAELLEVDESSYKYYRAGGSYSSEGLGEKWADAPKATFENGSVKWDLSEEGVLENGVTYTVTFDCYPSQTTYDIIAKLKNGDMTWDEVKAEGLDKYIVDNGGGSYSLRTNTNATLSYDDTRDEAGQQTVGYTNPDPVATSADSLPIEKKWQGGDPDVKEIPITVIADEDTEDEEVFHTTTLTAAGGWKASTFISVGIIKDGQALPGAEGHDFSFAELDDSQYHWEIDAPVVRPMLINGGGADHTPTMLIKVDDKHPVPSGATTYTIDGARYYVDSATTGLTATNHRRSNLNLSKTVTGEDAPKNATFPFTLTVNNSHAPKTEPTDDPNHNSDYWVWFSIYDTKAKENVKNATVGNATLSIDEETGDYYYYAPSGSAITVQMKDGWNLRFTNLPSETTYTFVEGTLPEGFAFNKAELTQGEDSTFSGDQTTTGTIENTKTSYQVEYTNDYALTDLEITKVWEDNDNQDGKRLTADELKAKLTLSPAVEGKEPTIVDNGDDTYTITYTGLPRFSNGAEVEYTVAESAIDGYTTEGSPAKDHGTITNTHEPEETEATVKKVWDDANNQDGKRPTSLEVTLSNGTKVTLNEGNQWTAKVENLPKYADGAEIVYSWSEDESKLPEGYSLTNTSKDGTVTTLTNSYKPEETEATVKKVWDDADNQDGKRPESLTVTLSNGTEVTLNEDNGWTATVDKLPKYADGKEIEYTWTEGDLPEGYELTDTSTEGTITTLTNSHTPEETEATVKKVWDDANDQDGKRPTELKVTLSNGTEVTLNKGNQWTATVENLPKYKEGEEIEYTWEEGTLPEGYELTDTSKDGTITTLTNSYAPEETSATVKKVWDDADNQDGIRPASLVVTLSDGEHSVTLSADNEWTATVTGLPKFADGKEIEYTWEEGALPEGYELTDTSVDGTVTTLTNTHTPAETEATVKKVWDDADNQDGKRPESLTVTLSDGQTVTLNEDNSWTATVTGLPKYKDGKEIDYTWTEASIEGYTLTGCPKEGTVTTLTNKHVPEQISIDVEKVWKDNDNQDGKRPESVTVNLLASGDIADTVELNEDNGWKYTWTKLDKYAGGEEIEYTVEEVKTDVITGEDGPGTYADEVTGEIAEGYIVTNTHTPETVDVSVKKVWDDDDDRDGKQPDSIDVTLSNGDKVNLGASNNWEATIKGLPKYNNGEEIAYTWTEASVDGYELTGTAAEGYVTELTNSHTPERTTVTVTKVWDDADDKDGIRPAEVNVTLLANGDEAGTATLSEDNGWTYTWTDLYKYEGGKEIAYTVSEEQVDGYDEPEITGTAADGYTIKNHHTAKPDSVSIDPPVQKIVEGDPAKPTTFTFQMKAITKGAPMPEGSEGGVKTTQITGTGSDEFGVVTYNEAGEWVYEITEIDDGAENYTYDTTVYTLTVNVEEVADGSQVKLIKTETLSGGDSGTATFTNIYKKDNVPHKKKVPHKKIIPQTGDDTPTGAMAAMTVFGAAALTAGTVLQRRKRK